MLSEETSRTLSEIGEYSLKFRRKEPSHGYPYTAIDVFPPWEHSWRAPLPWNKVGGAREE